MCFQGLSSLHHLQTIQGRQQLVNIIAEQLHFDQDFDANDSDSVHRLNQCFSMAIPLFSVGILVFGGHRIVSLLVGSLELPGSFQWMRDLERGATGMLHHRTPGAGKHWEKKVVEFFSSRGKPDLFNSVQFTS